MVPTIAMAIVMGVLPGVFLRPMEPSVKRTIERVTGRSYRRIDATSRLTLAARHRVRRYAGYRRTSRRRIATAGPTESTTREPPDRERASSE